jgi:TolA-binding protein
LTRIRALIDWTTRSKLRKAVVGTLGLGALAIMFASWSLLAHVAVDSLSEVTIGSAFVALDEGRYDDARAVIAELQDQPLTPDLLTGALFVLGAGKAKEASEETTADRRRALFQVAARYLERAVQRDLPPLRLRQAEFLWGKSLVLGGEPGEGIRVLESLLDDPAQPRREIHELLVDAYLDSAEPQLVEALRHNQEVLAEGETPAVERDVALLRHADILIRLDRPEEARKIVDSLSGDDRLRADREYLAGRLDYAEALPLKHPSEPRTKLLVQAINSFAEAQRHDAARGQVTRQSMYWTGRCHVELREIDGAVAQFDRLDKVYGDQPEAVAADLELAELHRARGEFDRSMQRYREVAESVGDPAGYSNPLLPVSQLRSRLTEARRQLVEDRMFGEALQLVDSMSAVFQHEQEVQLRAETLIAWGESLLGDGGGSPSHQRIERREGRLRFREAGVQYESLAKISYATREYVEILWKASDCYFRGQSFSSAERILQQYLREESRKDNSMALLRLGQCRLARRSLDAAIETFEECAELYPQDANSYQARLECARAYQLKGAHDRAEQLLRHNLASEALTPQSQEWRDSLFALGQLLYDAQRFEEAIASLEEAVQRYPDVPSALLAKYTIARAYHGAAEAPAEKVRDAKTENERQKNRRLVHDNLEAALLSYENVQRSITLSGQASLDPLVRELLLNCYMMKGSVLYELRRFQDARQAFGNVVTLYENQPIVLESLVQVANCWRRLDQPSKARVTLQRAQLALSRMPPNADFLASTNFSRQQWAFLLDQMIKW